MAVAGDVAGDRREPRRGITRLDAAEQAPVRREERLLRGVLRLVRIAQDQPADPEDEPRVLVEETGQPVARRALAAEANRSCDSGAHLDPDARGYAACLRPDSAPAQVFSPRRLWPYVVSEKEKSLDRFAHNLREHRRSRGISQERLAFRCRLHRTEISLLERGAREPRLSTIVRLARGLGVAPSSLLDGVD